ncbi:hypothetical protein HPB50_014825 [Hyalomma asiaticum]|uniref:Uncharacterized protein n=1 Tax=Hyalomma asiaticum TaxID=266040 RepID=A0ACB7SFV2_HYAAI|nr:hypothetical protein HPB50_014825 [Hyalomma asiaticum]
MIQPAEKAGAAEVETTEDAAEVGKAEQKKVVTPHAKAAGKVAMKTAKETVDEDPTCDPVEAKTGAAAEAVVQTEAALGEVGEVTTKAASTAMRQTSSSRTTSTATRGTVPARQKLARLTAREFASLLIDVLSEAKRRHLGMKQPGLEDQRLSDDEPLYDSVASDEDNNIDQWKQAFNTYMLVYELLSYQPDDAKQFFSPDLAWRSSESSTASQRPYRRALLHSLLPALRVKLTAQPRQMSTALQSSCFLHISSIPSELSWLDSGFIAMLNTKASLYWASMPLRHYKCRFKGRQLWQRMSELQREHVAMRLDLDAMQAALAAHQSPRDAHSQSRVLIQLLLAFMLSSTHTCNQSLTTNPPLIFSKFCVMPTTTSTEAFLARLTLEERFTLEPSATDSSFCRI